MATLFLSYARGDDEPFVERLYRDLSMRGFEVWWDRHSMPGRALTFLQEIRDAITARDRFVLVVGPKAVTSDYVRAEWLYALEIGKAINPVLRLGDYDLLPDELKLLDAPDFRDDGHYAARLETLVRQLSEPVAPLGKLIAVPSLPPHFLRRQDRLRALKDAVLADLHRPVVITGTVVRTGIHGMGGIGKSVLASALARDHEVRRAFPDGVFWIGIGQQPTLDTLQRRVAQALGDPCHFDNVLQIPRSWVPVSIGIFPKPVTWCRATRGRPARARTSWVRPKTFSAPATASWPRSAPTPSANRAPRTARLVWPASASTSSTSPGSQIPLASAWRQPFSVVAASGSIGGKEEFTVRQEN